MLTEKQMVDLVNNIADADGDGVMNFDEFKLMLTGK